MSIVTSNFVLFSFSTDFPHKFPSRTYEPILINKKYYANVNVDSATEPVYLIIAIFERFFLNEHSENETKKSSDFGCSNERR